ncbi:MAG: PAS domain-containing protein [Hyphomicrobiaceae bacterium]
MNDDLPRLLKSYAFVDHALAGDGKRMGAREADRLRRERDRIFACIMTYPSGDHLVTAAQLRFILQNLRQFAHDPEMLRHVQALSLDLLSRIGTPRERTSGPVSSAGNGLAAARSAGLNASSFRYFDYMSDRVGVFDRSYRYIYTNTANARFHEEDAEDFVGRPSWQVAGSDYFERINRPLMDMALDGVSVSRFCRNPNRLEWVHSVTFDPVRDERGSVVGSLLVSRLVADNSIPEDQILGL